LAFFLDRGALAHMRFGIDPAAYGQATEQLRAKYGTSRRMGTDRHGRAITGWGLSNGIVGLTEPAPKRNEAMLLWSSMRALEARMADG
jgi:hypothetical protein